MVLVAIAWMYVVLMMGVAEALSSHGTVLGAFVTVLLYGVLPLSVLLYIMGTPMRRRARLQNEQAAAPELERTDPQPERPGAAEAAADARQAPGPSHAPDSRSVPSGDAVTPVGEKA
jgi:hypothetical protein